MENQRWFQKFATNAIIELREITVETMEISVSENLDISEPKDDGNRVKTEDEFDEGKKPLILPVDGCKEEINGEVDPLQGPQQGLQDDPVAIETPDVFVVEKQESPGSETCSITEVKPGISEENCKAETKAAITLLSLADVSQPSTSTSHPEEESRQIHKLPEQSCSKFVVAICNSGEPQKCFMCAVKRRRKARYIVQKDGNVQYICHVNCFNIFRHKYARNCILSWDTKNLIDQTKTSYLVYQRKCIVCRKRIDKRYAFSWNMMDFCSEICLTKHIKAIGSICAKCNSEVSFSLLYKYIMRFANEIKSFCSSDCLTSFKMSSRACSFCQKDMSNKLGDFLGSVNDEGEVKEFCSGRCLLKYDRVVYKIPAEYEDGLKCSICASKINLTIEYDWNVTKKYFCNETCFAAFTTHSNIAASKCCMCEQYFPVEILGNNTMFYDQIRYSFCSIVCLNLYVITNQTTVSCAWCKTSKYNFDMIRISHDKVAVDLCSLSCLRLFKSSTFENYRKSCNFCRKHLQSAYHLTLQNETIRNFCSLDCAVSFNDSFRESSSTGKTSETPVFQSTIDQGPPLPVICNVQSLASNGRQSTSSQTFDHNSVAPITVKHHVVIKPAPMPDQRNVATLCQVKQDDKSTSLKPIEAEKEVQTDENEPKITALPIPFPVYLPSPLPMYSVPEPFAVATPLPFPVPLFIPTTRNSFNGIMDDIKEILEKTPADPYQAEMLLMADLVANKDKEEGKTGAVNDGGEGKDANSLILGWMQESKDNDLLQEAFEIAEEIVGEDSNFEVDTARLVINEEEPVNKPKLVEVQSCGDKDGSKQETSLSKIAIDSQPDDKLHLKYSIGVHAWVEWINAKNKHLEKPFKNEILDLTRDELNHSLSLFVQEVKKPNGNDYAPDTIYYLCLGIQYYLFKHNRFDNIFWDSHFQQFKDSLDQLSKKFCILFADSQYFVTRVEEEHLWESKQLGAHSPYVLLNTLLYLNTKYFYLTTVEEHMRVSFAHIMIDHNVHSKRRRSAKPKSSSNSVLRFYPPRDDEGLQNSSRPKKRMYEQHGNGEDPLRCPVHLYEFYLSKCPEGLGSRDDIFYLQPERSCVADSPIWYSSSSVSKDELEKMLRRINMVKEICVSVLGN